MVVRNAGGPPQMVWYIRQGHPDPKKLRKIYEEIGLDEAVNLQNAEELAAQGRECFVDETEPNLP